MLRAFERVRRLIRSYWFGRPNAYNSEMVSGARTTGAVREGIDNGRAKWSGRELVRNVGVAEAAVQAYAHRLVGSGGPTLNVQTGDPVVDDLIEGLWARWAAECTSDGQGLDHVIAQTGRELAVVGETFWYWGTDGGRLLIDSFDAECLQGPGIGGSGLMADGIERDEMGRPISYNVSFEDAKYGAGRIGAVKLSADRVWHVFEKKRPGQLRGESPFSQIGNILQMSEKSQRAELGALLLSGYMGLHVKTPPSTVPSDLGGNFGFDSQVQESEPAASTRLTADDFSLNDGAIHVGDYDLKLIEANRPGGHYLPFMTSLIRIVAARFGLPYAAISGDYSQNTGVNGRLEEITSHLHNDRARALVTSRLLKPLFRRWLLTQYGGAVPTSVGGRSVSIEDLVWAATFIWPAPPLLDPLRETQAAQAQVALGTKTWSQVCMDRGQDPIDQMRAIRKEREEADRIGVAIPIAGSGQGLVSNPLGEGGGTQGPGNGQQGNASQGGMINE